MQILIRRLLSDWLISILLWVEKFTSFCLFSLSGVLLWWVSDTKFQQLFHLAMFPIILAILHRKVPFTGFLHSVIVAQVQRQCLDKTKPLNTVSQVCQERLQLLSTFSLGQPGMPGYFILLGLFSICFHDFPRHKSQPPFPYRRQQHFALKFKRNWLILPGWPGWI